MSVDYFLEPLQGIPVDQLRKVASTLVQQQGEYKACGHALYRLIEQLYPPPDVAMIDLSDGVSDEEATAAGKALAQRKSELGFDQAYGCTTWPPKGSP